jgi:hypothetical protein
LPAEEDEGAGDERNDEDDDDVSAATTPLLAIGHVRNSFDSKRRGIRASLWVIPWIGKTHKARAGLVRFSC